MRPYHGNGDIIRVAAFLEPAEGADVVPARHLGGEVPLTEGAGRLDGPARGVVVVDGGEPAGQGLGLAFIDLTRPGSTYEGPALASEVGGVHHGESVRPLGVPGE